MNFKSRMCALLFCAIFLPAGSTARSAVDDRRELIDNSRGGFFMKPFNGQWNALGADDGLRSGYDYDAMLPDAVKAIHARLQHFELEDHNNFSYFPHDLCKAYEADEIARGRPPLWVTALWEGQHRPVLFSWHWTGGWGATQAINIRDERFIRFYINNYVRAGLMNPYRQNWWVGLDNCAFRYDLYGVLDDQATPVYHSCSELGISWDLPFPQNDQEWTDAAAYCFRRMKVLAPDIHFMCNEGTLADESKYDAIFANSDGIVLEGFLADSGSWGNWSRADFHDRIYKHLVTVYRDKLQIFQVSHLSSSDDTWLRTGYCAQLICGGANRFFGPSGDNALEVDPARYAEAKNSLGSPAADPVDAKLDSSGTNWLFSRRCEGGWVYFNNTAANYTVNLPAGTWYNRSGSRVTTLTIPRGEGDYVKDIPGVRCGKPQINPRRPTSGFPDAVSRTPVLPGDTRKRPLMPKYPTTGPLSIEISTAPWTSDAVIRYTVDGSEPDANSILYAGPFLITGSCTIRARAWKAGLEPSFVTNTSYSITSSPPKVRFHLATDAGSELLDVYPLVALDHPSGQTVRVQYRVAGGSAVNGVDYNLASGTLEFLPGEMYRHIKLDLIDNDLRQNNRTVRIMLQSPENAVLDLRRSFTCTIQDND